ncbi:hypothetical protein [Vibrio sp. ES.051]|uniref:hypothetical protein n=1 Tax=Vibrio sp. ES.051 TaxID=1761909 RepID=UPI000BF9C1D6
MTKKFWITGVLCASLLGLYWVSAESNLASAANPSDIAISSADNTKQQNERTPLIEVKQALTASALNRPHQQTDEDAFRSAPLGQEGSLTSPLNTIETSSPYSTTVGGDQNPAEDGPTGNRKPIINLMVEQQLQTMIYAWELSQNSPINYSLSLNHLFEDPDDDFLTTRIWLDNANGLSVMNQGSIMVQGAAENIETTTYLTVAARDDYHGDSDHAWTTTRFELPAVTQEQNDTKHPLEGDIVYRLETTHRLNGQYTLYEVVYCEAFKFVQQDVFYAASNNKTHCPSDRQLTKVGTYTVNADELTVSSQLSSLDAQQTWTLQKQYPSLKHPQVSNYFVSVYNGKQFESYTMQKSRSAMEARINASTGQYLYQMAFFDYLLPLPNGEYLVSEIGNFIYNHETQVVGPFGETLDSDLNLRTYEQTLRCADIAPWYDSHVIAGQGNYQIDIISTPYPDDPTYKIDCYQYTSDRETGQKSLAFDLNYSPYDELLEGEVYSYILRPKPQYAQRVEEIKLNLIYHAPPQ